MSKEIHSVAIVGMGALGLMFGKRMQEGIQDQVFFLMDEARKRKYQDQTFWVNEQEVTFPLISAKEATSFVDLAVVTVKYTGLTSAIELLKQSGCVGKDTILISFMNGIDSEEILGEAFGRDNIVYCVAQGMDAMKFGNSLKYTQMGELHIGVPKGAEEENLNALAAFFERVQLPYVKEEDILYRMWAKFMLNVGINQTCMAYGTTYFGALSEGEANETLLGAMRETVAVANQEGIPLSEKDVEKYIAILKTLDPDGTPSMGQDRINRKASEVDMFAGMVIRLAKKHGIAVPANEKLYRKVKEIEKEYVG